MANRHLSRSIAMQTLFEWDFKGGTGDIKEMLDYNIREFGPGIEGISFIRKLAGGVVEKKEKLDEIISKAAPEWPLDQIAPTDRNILRIGLYELLFSPKREVPSKVAINEAIELAKTFGGESSGRFINGVLGTVYREIGGEEEEKPKEEALGGAVVYRKKGDDFYFALVHDVFGYWTLSKGHIEPGENLEDGVRREIKEEIGLDIEIEKGIGENEYIASDPEKGKIKKKVNYFLASVKKGEEIKLKQSGGLNDARWFKMDDLADLRMYDDMKPIVANAVKILSKKK